MRRLAVLLLIDHRGWVLLQERDDHAVRYPNQWGLPGGHVEDGEEFEAAAYRELAEETGVRLSPGSLRLWADETYQYADDGDSSHYRIYAAATPDLTDADIVVGEGKQIVFVDPAELERLDMGDSAAYFVSRFLGSSLHAELTRRS